MEKKIRVFVIDDDEVIGEAHCKMLQSLGVKSWCYTSPVKALDEIEKHNPEIILLDYCMPEMNGDDFMIKFSERTMFSGRRVIFVTSHCEVKENQLVYQSLGIEEVIEKPMSIDDLKSLIDSQKKARALSHLKSKKIAVVDDDELSSKILIKNLEKNGCNCVYFNSGESLLEKLEEKEFDLILLDILMPGLSGIEVLKKVREKFNNVQLPIIMLTAKDEASIVVESLDSGANDFISKPVNPSIALARLKTQVELKDYYQDSLKKVELETLKAMIITYNHEINNPLGIALMNLKNDFSKMTEKNHTKTIEALQRISNITKSISNILDNGPSYSHYAGDQKMIKLKKDA